jgi:hypothetical protein
MPGRFAEAGMIDVSPQSRPGIGRTSIGRLVAWAARRPHSRAEPRSGTVMIRTPPICSLPSAKGRR